MRLPLTLTTATLGVVLLPLFALADAPKPLAVKIPERKEPVSYANEVADILAAKCVGCHCDVLAENRLKMEEVPQMLKGGKRGAALVPGKADDSLLFQMAAHRVEPVMPPKDKKDAPALTPEELGVLKLWIDSGAKDDSEENAQPTPIELGELPPGVQPINAVDLTSDGARVACGRANVVQVYDADSGLEILSLGGHKDLIQSLRYSPDGRMLAAGSYQIVTLWNAPTGGLKSTFKGHGDQVKAIATGAAAPELVASAGLDKTIRVWDGEGKLLHTYNIPAPAVALAATPELAFYAVSGTDNSVRLIDARNGDAAKEVGQFAGPTAVVNDLAIHASPDGEGYGLAGVSADGVVRLWNLPRTPGDPLGEPRVIAETKIPLKAVAVSPYSDVLAAAGDDGKVRLWSLPEGKELRTFDAHEGPVLALTFDPEGKRLLTGSADKTARIFNVQTGERLFTLASHMAPVNSVAFSLDGARVVTAGGEGGVKVWEAATGQGVIAFGHAAPDNAAIQPIQKVSITPTGRIVTASADKTLKSWTYEGSWSLRHTFGPHVFRVLAIDFNPDGTLLATGGGDPSRSGELKVFEVGKGLPVRTLDGLHSDTIFALRFSPDGSQLASAGADKFMKVTRVSDGKEVRAFEGHTHHVLAVDWKADGKQVVTGGADNVLKLWDVETGEQVRTMQGAGKQVTAVRWVAGKPQIFGACGDKAVRMWSGDGNSAQRTLSGPTDYVFAVAASADGSRIAAGGADSVLYLWNGQSAQIQRKIEPTKK